MKACIIVVALLASVQTARADSFRVQLLWFHQAQFAGFYLADLLGFYEQEGLRVELLEGGLPPTGGKAIDTLEVLAAGHADVAIAWLSNAIAARQTNARFVNIAQLFRYPGTTLVCRRDAGIHKPADLLQKDAGVWNLGDQHTVRYWLAQQGLPSDAVKLTAQRPDGQDLIEGRVACATAMAYNETWRIFDAGLTPSDTIRFSLHGAAPLEDGLYAPSSSLKDPHLRGRLVRFLRATMKGWRYAREHPEEALYSVRVRNPQLQHDHQRRMLEAVLRLAEPENKFGLLDIAAFDRGVEMTRSTQEKSVATDARSAWTHAIWREAAAGGNPRQFPAPATVHYARELASTGVFTVVLYFGVFFYALFGILEAFRSGYTIWGQLIIGFACALGGGMVRDLIIAGDRLPFGFVGDTTALVGILAIAVATTALSRLFPRLFSGSTYRSIEHCSEAIGFGILTVYGAIVALKSGMPWYWLPLCAAITCSGGGLIMNIIMGRKSDRFRGAIYEEVAILGALVFIVGLLIQDSFEHSPWILAAGACVVGIGSGLLRYWIDTRGIRYPNLLVGRSRNA